MRCGSSAAEVRDFAVSIDDSQIDSDWSLMVIECCLFDFAEFW